jgi:membrane glycosyltransferase
MDAAPRLGILQTVPVLAGGATPFARLQQFAGRLYGPVIARGVAAWQGLDGNYWGHNALIRVRAFAENCGLPELPGRMPFGGHVLSHDFVEAALIRRGGWEVRMDPDLGGSWEGSPPSILDVAARDRRWAQGNLQHSKILGARGLRLPNRLHFLIGIGAYLMSPLWLALLLVGMALTAQTVAVDHKYFPDGQQLFPNWPVFDAVRMGWLFGLSMLLLLLPKLVGLAAALVDGPVRRAFGGGLRLVGGAVAEVVLSALAAPVLMLMQARQVWEILSGRDSGWSAQTREGAATPWRVALRRHRGHVLAGLLAGAAFLWFAPGQFLWLAPVVAGLVLAPLLSRVTSDPAAGRAMARLGLLATPEDIVPPAVAVRAEAATEAFAHLRGLTLADMAEAPGHLADHLETLAEVRGGVGEGAGGPNLAAITARAKIEAASCPREAEGWLTAEETEAVLGSADLLRRFAGIGEAPAVASG